MHKVGTVAIIVQFLMETEFLMDAESVLLPAATKLGQGNIFTSVCLSTGGRGVCLSACWDIHAPEQTPPGIRHPPPEQTQAYGQRAASTHPTGMHSCCKFTFVLVFLITIDISDNYNYQYIN